MTRHPTAEWLAQQIVEAFPWDTAPTYWCATMMAPMGPAFTRRVRAMGIRDRPISPRSPWQNAYVERLIGTLRHDCLDHYNETRTHLGLGKDAPLRRAVQRSGTVVATPILSGLHHRYGRM